MFGDLDTIQENIHTTTPDPTKSNTTKITNHQPCSVAYKIISTDPAFYQPPKVFKGVNCNTRFLDSLKDDVSQLKDILRRPIAMELTKEEDGIFLQASSCHICDQPATDADHFVRNHSHLTGEFVGAAHNSCNLNYRDCQKIPIFFHNLKGYDSHLILSHVKPEKHGRITCIPKNRTIHLVYHW